MKLTPGHIYTIKQKSVSKDKSKRTLKRQIKLLGKSIYEGKYEFEVMAFEFPEDSGVWYAIMDCQLTARRAMPQFIHMTPKTFRLYVDESSLGPKDDFGNTLDFTSSENED